MHGRSSSAVVKNGDRWEHQALPGSRRHLNRLARDLDEGFSCLWIVPDHMVERGAVEKLLTVLEQRLDAVRVPAPEVFSVQRPRAALPRWGEVAASSGDIPGWARNAASLFDDEESFDVVEEPEVESSSSMAERLFSVVGEVAELDGDLLERIVSEGWMRGRTAVLRAWEEQAPDDVGTTLTRLTAHVKEYGVSPERRPRLLVAARLSDLPSDLLERVDPVTTRTRWWWGACGRLDTAVVVEAVRSDRVEDSQAGGYGHIRDLVAFEVLVEVAGADLELAAYLAANWDGKMASLAGQVRDIADHAGDPMPALPRNLRQSGDRPSHELRPAWDAGALELWEGQVRLSPGAPGTLEAPALDALVWRGQNRALTPVIDSHRVRLEEVFRSRATMSVLAEMARGNNGHMDRSAPQREVFELGPMAWAVSTQRVSLPYWAKKLLYCLRDMRNLLAHLVPLADGHLELLVQLLDSEQR